MEFLGWSLFCAFYFLKVVERDSSIYIESYHVHFKANHNISIVIEYLSAYVRQWLKLTCVYTFIYQLPPHELISRTHLYGQGFTSFSRGGMA